jgi:aspartyl/asparaginyl beta-hydroxylase (cupin superfamily)
MDQPNLDNLARKGVEALRSGDARTALSLFQDIVAQGGQPPWLAMARACHLVGDSAGEEQALQRQLDLDKRDLPALLAMGELKAKQGDSRAASSFFKAALNMAALGQPAPQLMPLLNRANDYLRETSRRYEEHLASQLEAAGLGGEGSSPRLRRAIDLMLGRTQLYLQQPNMFYFPELPQRAFYEREEFDWIPAIEAEIPAMIEELGSVLAQDEAFEPYIQGTPGRPLPNNALLHDPSWGAYYLWQSGEPVQGHFERCPRTMAALEQAPMPRIKRRSPQALYSLLKPGTHIKPHHGMLNTRLICHIPLVIPPDCAIRVGSETRSWTPGELLIFDDSFEHEAWNRSDSNRIVLIFEIWRPEISRDEQAELTTLFEAIDLFPSGEGPDA